MLLYFEIMFSVLKFPALLESLTWGACSILSVLLILSGNVVAGITLHFLAEMSYSET